MKRAGLGSQAGWSCLRYDATARMTVIAVTGVTGHVGACLVRQLIDQGHSVRGLVRAPAASIEGLDFEQVPGDVCDAATLPKLLEGAELVFHLAAVISITGPMDGLVDSVNVKGARNVAEAALRAGVRRMVHVCSVHAFQQEPLSQAVDEDRTRVHGRDTCAYDLSKAMGEAAVRKVVEQGRDAVVVHPSGVVGPFDFSPSRMGQVLLNLYERKLPGLVEGGFDWVDVRDVAAGIQQAAEHGRKNESYLLTGNYAPMAALADLAQAITGVRPPRLTSPMWLARLGAPVMERVAKLTRSEPLYTSESLLALRANKVYSKAKSSKELDYRPRPLEHTVRDVYGWFAARGMLKDPPPNLLAEQFGEVGLY